MKETRIVVKTERNVEIRLGIKRENSSKRNVGVRGNSRSINRQPIIANSNSWTQGKQTLIDKIISLKSENQRYTLDLKKTQDKLKAAVSKNQELEAIFHRNNETHTDKVNDFQCELTKLNTSYEKLKTDGDKQMTILTRDRNLLQAQSKQFQTVISQQIDAKEVKSRKNRSESDEEEYEVERLLDDKLVENRIYLVRWKGYDSLHDSWVEQTKLICPSILKKYKLKSKRK